MFHNSIQTDSKEYFNVFHNKMNSFNQFSYQPTLYSADKL